MDYIPGAYDDRSLGGWSARHGPNRKRRENRGQGSLTSARQVRRHAEADRSVLCIAAMHDQPTKQALQVRNVDAAADTARDIAQLLLKQATR
ncbi:hypothetical protein XAC3810_870001 [Xanthomonas citri pv. citri]|uniref:Uncharacterized protein n=1 Tax=Xanthomonas citri pv. citri TaxID=611301 RepID=A0A0U5BMX1_XANCI|nr:hypothetical protein HZS91_04734 [Xanthomonas citri pv. citri]QYF47273.1 hypothetical protein HZS93_04655 [Xanthomonas citri]CEE15525.1 hypothetical protein XAC3824_1020001 [Xanthomonas citri pv. citri]CEE22465.1 hypothetical protein XAC902_1170002 [Xanthomonas citri pv. citri]CEE25410.1 hypothetical protein XAC908_1230001 [Xanthomonas citri pv. citri]